jgi:formylglycine-generating enzyme required for sulfatase activity
MDGSKRVVVSRLYNHFAHRLHLAKVYMELNRSRQILMSKLELFLIRIAIVSIFSASLTVHSFAQSNSNLDALTSQLQRFRSEAWFLPDSANFGFVAIPAGTFRMGSDPLIDPMAFGNERWSESRRQGEVDVPEYYIARFETTTAQFAAFVEATNYRADPQALQNPLDHPVSFVSWTDAVAYSRWLDQVLRDSPLLPQSIREFLADGGHVTLPNEAEWEKAARGIDGRIYPWGNQMREQRANIGSTGTRPVGSFSCPECVYSLADMSGNVWEWTRSPSQDYPFDSKNYREKLAEDALWIIRGGSFNDTPNNARSAVRGAADPGARRAFIGFRVVISKQ